MGGRVYILTRVSPMGPLVGSVLTLHLSWTITGYGQHTHTKMLLDTHKNKSHYGLPGYNANEQILS